MPLSHLVKMVSLSLFFGMISPMICFGEEIVVELTERSSFDDEGISILPFFRAPKEDLILPEIKSGETWFLQLGFPPPIIDGDRLASVMVVIQENGDFVYVDRNNDNDLTNDGEPIFYPLDENDLWIFLHSTKDPGYKFGMLFQRKPKSPSGKPDLRSKLYSTFVDSMGNVLPPHVRVWGQHYTDFEGKVRTFYYTQYLHLSRGTVNISGKTHEIAIYDANFNGRFNDPRDRIIVDTDGNGGIYRSVSSESFSLTDVFPLGSKNYKLSHVDPYGKRLHIIETKEQSTSLFSGGAAKANKSGEILITERMDRMQGVRSRRQSAMKLNASFWDLQFRTIDDKVIRFADYKGSYLLLNFWGEWCAPCIKEIPTLVRVRREYSDSKIVLIGMLKAQNLEKARQMIHDREITWPQIELDNEVSGLFSISSYPTNILILPDGETYLEQGYVEYGFFKENIE